MTTSLLRQIFVNPAAWLGLWLFMTITIVWIAGTVTNIAEELQQPLQEVLAQN